MTPTEGMRNGGGTVLDTLVVLTALGAAALAALAIAKPAKRKPKVDDERPKKQ